MFGAMSVDVLLNDGADLKNMNRQQRHVTMRGNRRDDSLTRRSREAHTAMLLMARKDDATSGALRANDDIRCDAYDVDAAMSARLICERVVLRPAVTCYAMMRDRA